MRRILVSKRGEFSYQIKRSTSLGLAIKRFGEFFEGVEKKEGVTSSVTVSNKIVSIGKAKVRSS